MQITTGASRGQLVSLVFGQKHVAAGQTDVQLPVAMAETGVTVYGYTAPWPGRIVGIAYALEPVHTATGFVSFGATIDGVEDADTTVTAYNGFTTGYHRVMRDRARFAAGVLLGCELTSSGDWSGTNHDCAVAVYVVFDMGEI